MSKKPIFIVVTAENCPACKMYKTSIRSELLKKIQGSNNLRVLEITVPTLQSPIDTNTYHPKLVKLAWWFPTFIVVSAKSWNNRTGPLEAEIFNGAVSADGTSQMLPFEKKIPINASNITKWAIDLSKKAPFKLTGSKSKNISDKSDKTENKSIAPTPFTFYPWIRRPNLTNLNDNKNHPKIVLIDSRDKDKKKGQRFTIPKNSIY